MLIGQSVKLTQPAAFITFNYLIQSTNKMETCAQITSQNASPPCYHYCLQVSCQTNSIYVHNTSESQVLFAHLFREGDSLSCSTDYTTGLESGAQHWCVPSVLGSHPQCWSSLSVSFPYPLHSCLISFPPHMPSLRNTDLKGFHYYHCYYFNKQGSFQKIFGYEGWNLRLEHRFAQYVVGLYVTVWKAFPHLVTMKSIQKSSFQQVQNFKSWIIGSSNQVISRGVKGKTVYHSTVH